MNKVLSHWNSLSPDAAATEVLPCCGSQAWAMQLAAARPIHDADALLTASTSIWQSLPAQDWQQAFESHPRIGQHHASAATAQSLRWSSQEQRQAASDDTAKAALAEANRRYEARFGRIFLIRAAGRSSAEILSILETRMNNDDHTELLEAAEQQRQITGLRLQRWLEGQ